MSEIEKEEEERGYIAWWMRNNWSYEPDPDRSIVLQAMRNGEIAFDIGPYAIEFAKKEMRAEFCQNGGLDELAHYLSEKNPGVYFLPITLTEAGPDEEVLY